MARISAVILVLLAFVLPDLGLAAIVAPSSDAGAQIKADDNWLAKSRKKKKKKKRKVKKSTSGDSKDAAGTTEEYEEEEEADTGNDAAGTAPAGSTEGTPASGEWGSPGWSGGADAVNTDTSGSPSSTDSSTSRYKRDKGVPGAMLIARPLYSVMSRKLTYSEEGLRPYETSPVASFAGVHLEFFPGVLAEMSGLDAIGLRLGYGMALGLKSAPKEDKTQSLSTAWNQVDFGLCGRLVFDDVLLVLGVDYGMLKFDLNLPTTGGLSADTANFNYKFVRLGLDVRFAIDDLALLAGGAYRLVLDTGPIKDVFFPKSSASGFDGYVGASYQVIEWLEAYFTVSYARFSHSFNPEATAIYKAKSGTDAYFGGNLGVNVFF